MFSGRALNILTPRGVSLQVAYLPNKVLLVGSVQKDSFLAPLPIFPWFTLMVTIIPLKKHMGRKYITELNKYLRAESRAFVGCKSHCTPGKSYGH